MPCRTAHSPGGAAIVCTRPRPRRCTVCNRPGATRLCDWPKPGGGTCDRALCDRCAVPAGENRDHCPHHERPEAA